MRSPSIALIPRQVRAYENFHEPSARPGDGLSTGQALDRYRDGNLSASDTARVLGGASPLNARERGDEEYCGW